MINMKRYIIALLTSLVIIGLAIPSIIASNITENTLKNHYVDELTDQYQIHNIEYCETNPFVLEREILVWIKIELDEFTSFDIEKLELSRQNLFASEWVISPLGKASFGFMSVDEIEKTGVDCINFDQNDTEWVVFPENNAWDNFTGREFTEKDYYLKGTNDMLREIELAPAEVEALTGNTVEILTDLITSMENTINETGEPTEEQLESFMNNFGLSFEDYVYKNF